MDVALGAAAAVANAASAAMVAASCLSASAAAAAALSPQLVSCSIPKKSSSSLCLASGHQSTPSCHSLQIAWNNQSITVSIDTKSSLTETCQNCQCRWMAQLQQLDRHSKRHPHHKSNYSSVRVCCTVWYYSLAVWESVSHPGQIEYHAARLALERQQMV